MTIELNNHSVNAYITGEDVRYPTLVIQGDNWVMGYNVDVNTGNLSRVCICAAYESSECCCGAWGDFED